jgi:hypothetical protein
MVESLESRVLDQKARLTDRDFLVMKIAGVLIIGAATLLGTYLAYEFLCSKPFDEVILQFNAYFSSQRYYAR